MNLKGCRGGIRFLEGQDFLVEYPEREFQLHQKPVKISVPLVMLFATVESKLNKNPSGVNKSSNITATQVENQQLHRPTSSLIT
jgi:hypothetical protein